MYDEEKEEVHSLKGEEEVYLLKVEKEEEQEEVHSMKGEEKKEAYDNKGMDFQQSIKCNTAD